MNATFHPKSILNDLVLKVYGVQPKFQTVLANTIYKTSIVVGERECTHEIESKNKKTAEKEAASYFLQLIRSRNLVWLDAENCKPKNQFWSSLSVFDDVFYCHSSNIIFKKPSTKAHVHDIKCSIKTRDGADIVLIRSLFDTVRCIPTDVSWSIYLFSADKLIHSTGKILQNENPTLNVIFN